MNDPNDTTGTGDEHANANEYPDVPGALSHLNTVAGALTGRVTGVEHRLGELEVRVNQSNAAALSPQHLEAVEQMGHELGKATGEATNGRFSALETGQDRLSRTVDILLEIIDGLVRHKGQVHNAAHLDALTLLLEDASERDPTRLDVFAGARGEITRRTLEENTKKR